MGDVVALPARGEVLLDARGQGRALRVTWHHESDVVVLSLWRGGLCSATFRLAAADVPVLVSALTSARPGPESHPGGPPPSPPSSCSLGPRGSSGRGHRR